MSGSRIIDEYFDWFWRTKALELDREITELYKRPRIEGTIHKGLFEKIKKDKDQKDNGESILCQPK